MKMNSILRRQKLQLVRTFATATVFLMGSSALLFALVQDLA